MLKLLKKVCIYFWGKCSKYSGYYKGKILTKKFCWDSDRYYIITSHGIGDVAWMCVYLTGFIEQSGINKEKIIIVTQEKLAGIITSFYEEYELKYCKNNELIFLQQYLSNTRREYNNIKLAIFPLMRMNKLGIDEFILLSRAGAGMDKLYRIGCFDLPVGLEMVPNITTHYHSRKKVVLVPYVNSRNRIPLRIWNEIVSIFQEKDVDIYTNTGTEEPCLEGTKPLFIGLKDIPSILGPEDLVIGGRCGLMDWLFIARKYVIILHSIYEVTTDKMMKARNDFAKWESFSEMQKSCPMVFDQKFVRDIRLNIRRNGTSDLVELKKAIREFYEEIGYHEI